MQITIKAKDLASEITNSNIKKGSYLSGEKEVSDEHVKNNHDVRDLLSRSGIRPEDLAVEEDIKKIQRKLKSDNKLIVKNTKKLKI